MKRIIAILSLLLIFLTLVPLLVSCSNNSRGVKLIDISLSEEQYAFGVNKNDPELLYEANKYLAMIKEDGTFDAICEKYFGNGTPAEITSAAPNPKKDQLIVATSTGFEPFEMVDGGKYSGIDIEIAKGLADYLGKELVIKDMEFKAVITSVQSGLCDIAMAGLTITPIRCEQVDFTTPYYSANQVLIVKADNDEFDACKSAEDVVSILNSKDSSTKIGCQTGTTGEIYIDGDSDEDGGYGFAGLPVTKMGYDYAALAVNAVINGQIDYVIVDDAPARAVTSSVNEAQHFSAKLEIFHEKFIENGAWKRVLGQGLVNTLVIAFSGLLIGILIGTPIAAVKVMPKYKRLPRILDRICSIYVGFFRGTPIVVQLLLAYYVLFPTMGINIGSVNTCILVFGLNSAAYVSEIMRGGILSVDRGQMEAGRALGLSYFTAMIKIVVPQAVKNILPTLGNELIALVKDTSVVSFVAAVDIYKTFTEIGNKTYEYLVPYLFMALIYIALVAIITLVIRLIERRLRKSDRG